MLIIVMLLITIAMFVIVLTRRDRLSVYMAGLCCSFLVMFSGAITYVAKMGGYNKGQRMLLFLLPEIQNKLQFLIVPLGKLGYWVAIGRCLFPFFFLLVALECTMIPWFRRHRTAVHIGITIPVVLSLIYYYPSIFTMVVGKQITRLIFMKNLVSCWIIGYVVFALVLLLKEYLSITIPFCKRNFRFILLSQLSVLVLYGMYAIQDPGQIYNMYVFEYIKMGSLGYIKSALSSYGWIVFSLCTVLFVSVGTYSMLGYTSFNYGEAQEDIRLKRSFDATSYGTSVFVHSVKNQLLASRVLYKKVDKALLEPDTNLQQVSTYMGQLQGMNDSMLERMEDLYKAVKSNNMILKPTHTSEIFEMAVERFHQKYPEQEIKVTYGTKDTLVLADLTNLSEGIYNLLANGYEAVLVAEREAKLELLIHDERLYTVYEVKDNGCGISKTMKIKIFDPFYTSKNTNFNWGMGLFYVRKIVKGHIGTMRIESEPGKGTNIFLMLPKYENTSGHSQGRIR